MHYTPELPERFYQWWKRVGAQGGAVVAFENLRSLYATPCGFRVPRAYHTLAHIEHCLRLLDDVRPHLTHADSAEFALWCHDAVYIPGEKSNESQSAIIAVAAVEAFGLSGPFLAVGQHVLATAHMRRPESVDAQYIADIDVSVLAIDEERYTHYSKALRAEFAGVSDEAWRVGRCEFLQKMLERAGKNELFYTPHFALFHAVAIENMERELRGFE